MASKKYLLAIDQGTTGSTVLIVDENLKIVSSTDQDFKQIYPKPGWVEHDLNDIWKSVLFGIKTAVKKSRINPQNIIAIGISNQRETSCFWNKSTSEPLYNAIVWQDRRTSSYCSQLIHSGEESLIQKKTGLLIDPYFSATKIKWALENIPAVKKAASLGKASFGTIDSYLVAKLTDGQSHFTEPSNASRTMLFNIEKLCWDKDLLQKFSIPESMLPEVLNSNALFGKTKKVPGLPDGIPICGILGDQQAALLGQACTEEGMAKCTYGTGSFILMNTGARRLLSKHRLLTTIAWKMSGKTDYALEGGAFTAGAAVQWLRDGLEIIKKSNQVEKLASTVSSSEGLVFVPAFTGIGAPHWNPDARASVFGMSRGTTKAHIARATLEGIALMNADILKAMESDLGMRLKSLNVDGGASANNLLMQLQSDLLERKLIRPKITETTVLGAVFAAGLGAKVWSELSDIQKSWKTDKVFFPKMNSEQRDHLIGQWKKAIQSTISFAT